MRRGSTRLLRLPTRCHARTSSGAVITRSGRRLRLACQCAADSDEVTLAKYSGFWGQDLSAESAEPADDFETYFGNLEYPFENLGRPRRESPSSSNGMSNGSSSRGGRGDGRTDEI